jgi:hypothetical protein
VELALGGVLALGVGPPDVQAVDPDPVPAVRVGGVAGQPGQPGLGRDVRGQVRLPRVSGAGDDVDDGARGLAGDQIGHHRLHEEEGRLQVHRDVRVEQLRGGIEQRAPAGHARGVDQAVHPAERGDHRGGAGPRPRDVAYVSRDEQRLGPGRVQLGDQCVTWLAPPPADRDDRSFPGRGPGDGRAQPRRAAADQHHPVRQQARPGPRHRPAASSSRR